jgi:phosphate transport system ATP-binding protein
MGSGTGANTHGLGRQHRSAIGDQGPVILNEVASLTLVQTEKKQSLSREGVIQPLKTLENSKVRTEDLNAWYGNNQVLKKLNIEAREHSVTAIIGPSGCGKSTFIRCLNRMHELVPRARTSGRVILDGSDIYAKGVDPVTIRRRVGMVFQKPNPFPTMSVYDNVAAGLKLNGERNHEILDRAVQRSLELAFLWDEVKGDLDKSGASLSGGQQQRLCIARALAVEPEVILMDEPCSALDPIATAKIEELIASIKENYTVVIVTHNMQQAARVSDFTAFLYLGQLIEYGETTGLFENPVEELTERYLTGKFG